ncbi:MAG: hypothetical protein H7840_04155 [Alphaproteobacteria bacterium]
MMEELLILDQARAAEVRAAVAGRRLHIVQEASPRVVLVDGEAADLAALAGVAGVLLSGADLCGESTSTEARLGPLGLTTTEALFVTAWIRRRTAPAKSRSGDGADWDAPGFAAP